MAATSAATDGGLDDNVDQYATLTNPPAEQEASDHSMGERQDHARPAKSPMTMTERLEQLRREHKETGPRSAYYTGPPGKDSVFGTAPCGVIGRDLPRAVIRIERDYSGGELCQFHPTFPLELEGRIAPVLFSETMNDLNAIIIDANHAGWACLDNTVAILSLYISPLLVGTRYQKYMRLFYARIDEANQRDFHPVGLHIRDPRDTAFLFLEIEYF